ncbi:hypothetical protein NK718_06055 [Alsobacter sp. SYSU M60028]|uniref:DUF1311 domain-containing protein n=1 Tax=Alsobacter ponti TaxID=2962936 RepID=A0ABT1L9A5_9HYPH|nr:hypothetical protein [Alsobacter ponti]MCP8938071.1 hypothetical protein [Alsobacter ponti]
MKLTVPIAVLGWAGLALGVAGPARAQLMLPNASGPAPGQEGVVTAPAAPPRPPAPKIASESSVIGKTLYLNGSKGKLVIDRKGPSGLQASLVAVGDRISNPTESCGLDLGGGKPLDMTPVGRAAGAPRYEIRIPSCPITVDILEGAALVSNPEQACVFPEGDCKVNATGLWGPTPASLEGQAASIEKDRGRADRVVIESYKALYARTKDRNEIKKIAAEQADFSSARETMCRDYAREAVHGFCATRFTELRATELVERISKMDGREFVPESTRPRAPRPPADVDQQQAPPPVAAAPPPRREQSGFWLFNLFR